jgi:hypothetical protein
MNKLLFSVYYRSRGAIIELTAGRSGNGEPGTAIAEFAVIVPSGCNVIQLTGSAESPVRGAEDAGNGVQKGCSYID